MTENTVEQQPKTTRDPSLAEASVPIIAVVLCLGIGYGMLGLRIELLLITAAIVTGLVAMRLGLTWDDMQAGIVESISRAMPAILIVIVVGALIASWIVAGTIPTIVLYGLDMISPRMFLLTAYLLCSLVSLVIGTSWGTIGTVGVALIGIAHGLDVSLPAAAGAIVAGAYFGDKLSPFSDTTNLAPIAARANLYDHIKHMLWTTTPAWLIGAVVYTIADRNAASDFDHTAVDAMRSSLHEIFWIHPLLLLPAAITLGASILKKPVIPGMLVSIVVALGLAMMAQNLDDRVLGPRGTYEQTTANWVRIAKTVVLGPMADTGNKAVNSLIGRGGMVSMMDTALIAFCAFAFAGIAQRARMLDVLLARLSRFARTTGQLIAATVGACLTMAMVTGNSYLSILVPGELFRSEYRRRGLAAKNLSRTTEDCGTVVVPILPWSIASVFISNTLGVSTLQYAPWAVMCYTGVLFALLCAFTGIGIAPLKREDETLVGS